MSSIWQVFQWLLGVWQGEFEMAPTMQKGAYLICLQDSAREQKPG
jgi:hypothetical protein